MFVKLFIYLMIKKTNYSFLSLTRNQLELLVVVFQQTCDWECDMCHVWTYCLTVQICFVLKWQQCLVSKIIRYSVTTVYLCIVTHSCHQCQVPASHLCCTAGGTMGLLRDHKRNKLHLRSLGGDGLKRRSTDDDFVCQIVRQNRMLNLN